MRNGRASGPAGWWLNAAVLDSMIARIYEPVLGRLVGGLRRAGLALHPPRPGLKVLDVGCGTGAHLSLYADAGCRVCGIDVSAAMLDEARRRLGEGGLLVGADARELPFADAAFDLVVAVTLLHGLPAGARVGALEEMARVAGRRGRVLVIDHAPEPARGFVTRTARALGVSIEALSGHLAGCRSFWAAGGAPGLAREAGLVVERHEPAAYSTFGVYLLRAAGPVPASGGGRLGP